MFLQIAGKRCNYCDAPATFSERVGSVRFYVCEDSDCNRQFDEEVREADGESTQAAQEAAYFDNYDRYR